MTKNILVPVKTGTFPYLQVAIGIVFLVLINYPNKLLAQITTSIVPDTTLPGGNNSLRTRIGNRIDISGGHTVGSNLFHSFSDFQVSSGDSASFRSQGASNILSRVTGNNPSNLFGTIGVDIGQASRSNANLFFLNPNGVVFGPNASLDLRGSFNVSTANYIQLGSSDNNRFSAKPDNLALLTSAPPSAFGFFSDKSNRDHDRGTSHSRRPC